MTPHGLQAFGAAALLALVTAPALAQPAPAAALPDTPPGVKARLFLEAFNADAAAAKAFVATHWPKANAAMGPEMVRLQETMGGLDYVGVGLASDTQLTMRVKTRKSGAELLVIVSVEPEPPHNVRVIGITR